MTAPTVFSPATLAARWDCSERHIRNMISTGKLPHFKVGTLLRIKREDVEKIECPIGGLPDYTENSASLGKTTEDADVIDLEPQIQKKRTRRQRLDTPTLRARWAQR